MKIAIIAEQLAFPLIHAPHQQIFQIQKRLIQRGHEVTVLCLLSHKKSHSRSFLDSRHFRELIQSIKRINKILKEQKFDIVHLHFNLMALLWVMKFLPKTTKNIVVYPFKGKCGTNELTRFSLNNILNPSILKLKLRKFMSFAVPNFILRDCLNNNRIKAIMVPSFQAKNLLTPILRTNKIHVLPLGIDFEKVTAQRVPDSHLLKEDLGLSKYDKVIAYFGWLLPNRGVKTLISAIPILHKRIPKINLLLLSPPSSLVETGPVLKSIQSSPTKNKIKLKLQFLP